MDAFLLSMILTFVIAFGGREQLIVAQFSAEAGRTPPLLATGAICAILTAAIMAYAGAMVAAILPQRAAEMLVAFALAAAAGELCYKVSLKRMKEPTRSFIAIGAVLFARQMGDAARFIIFAIAAWSVYPTTALIGGALGGVAAVALGWAIGLPTMQSYPLRYVRLGLAACLGVAALMIGMNARFEVF